MALYERSAHPHDDALYARGAQTSVVEPSLEKRSRI